MAEHPATPDSDDLRRIADAAERRLAGADLSRRTRRIVTPVVDRVRRAAGYEEARAAIAEAAGQLDEARAQLDALRADLRARQERRSQVEPFSHAWWDLLRLGIVGAAPGPATAAWMRGYAQAFVAARFDVCAELSRAPELLADRDLARRMFTSARAAHDGNLAAGLPALETLTESALTDTLPAELRLKAWCMRLRALSRGLGDPPRAKDLGLKLIDALPAEAVPAVTTAALHTALGECLLASEDPRGAAQECRQALRVAPGEPAGYVLRGLIAEHSEQFSRADEWYEDAVEAGGARAVAGELFAPVPPNLLWKYGRRVRDTDPREAARVIRRALGLGIRGAGEYPERKAFVDLGRALEKRPDRRPQAAEAFWEAGRRYAWNGDETSAMTYLDKACALQPQDPRYSYERAEVLRLRAVHEDGTVDLQRLELAAQAWRYAYSMGLPARDAPWAYLTTALIAHERSGDLYRPRPSWEAAATLERGLLADPGNARVTAQLAQAHRLLGNRWSALALSTGALDSGRGDELAFDQHLLALMEVERYAEALELLDGHGLRSDQPWLVNRMGQLLVALGRPQQALDLLHAVTPSDPALHDLLVAVCEHLLGRREAAREAAQRVRDRRDQAVPAQRSYLVAQACSVVGDHDQAVDLYGKAVDGDPEDAALRWGLGQALLARGTIGDLGQGRAHALQGIAMSRSVFALGYLRDVELPWLLDLVADADHEKSVRSVVEDLAARIRHRRELLATHTDSAAELSAVLAEPAGAEARDAALAGLGRLDLADGRADRALERYLELARAGQAEAAYGITTAALSLRTAADGQAFAHDQHAAMRGYTSLLAALRRAPEPDQSLLASTHLRAALTAVELDLPAEFAEHVVHAFPPDLPDATRAALRKELSHLIVRPEQYWKVVDAGSRLLDGSAADRATVAATARLRSAMDLAVLLGVSQEDVHATQLFPLAVPLIVHLDAALLGRDPTSGRTFGELLTEMRARVERETGVFLPVIDAQPLGADGSYAIDLYEVRLTDSRVPPGRYFVLGPGAPGCPVDGYDVADPLTGRRGRWVDQPPDPGAGDERPCGAAQFVVRHLEAIIRASLPRMFSIDDVGLWLSAVPSSTPVDAGDADRLSRADRLELLRLLRLLLREQVPIVDQEEIFQVVCGSGPEWSALDLLPEVRRRIRHRLAPARLFQQPPAVLPAGLEAGFAAGLSRTEAGTWELARADVRSLADDVLAWRATAPGPLIVVRDPRLRPFLWRMLSGLLPGPFWVLSEEELP